MGWVTDARRELAAGRQVQVRPQGGSMRGRIESGQLVTLAPVLPADIRVDDVVFVAWRGNFLLHLVKERNGDQLLIGNNLGKVNGWASVSDVLGKVIAVAEAADLKRAPPITCAWEPTAPPATPPADSTRTRAVRTGATVPRRP
jgi:hypothetical protein